MERLDRRTLICTQDMSDADIVQKLTGIDFIRIPESGDQKVIEVFFLLDPAILSIAGTLPVEKFANPDDPLDPVDPLDPYDISKLSIGPVDVSIAAASVKITEAHWRTDIESGRTYLEIKVEEPGDFSNYRLLMDDDVLDWYFRTIEFSFKSGCPTDYDCKTDENCPDEAGPYTSVDYFARDFESFRDATLAFLKQNYPDWQEVIPADIGVMIIELFCALADEFAYIQDQISHETKWATARHKRSVHNMARLMDYPLDHGARASTWLTLMIKGSDTLFNKEAVFWAPSERGEALAFEAIIPEEPLEDYGSFPYAMHEDWNEMTLHDPDDGQGCLEKGATSALIAPRRMSDTDYISPMGGTNNNWKGRVFIFRMDPEDPSRPHRVHAVTIRDAKTIEDPLMAGQNSLNSYTLTQIEWDVSEALPASFSIAETLVHGNNILVKAGGVEEVEFRVGKFEPGHSFADLPPAIFRYGPNIENNNTLSSERLMTTRFGLSESILRGLAFDETGKPEIQVKQYDKDNIPMDSWDPIESLIEADITQPFFAVEPGYWGEVKSYERMGEIFKHYDYISGDGYSLVFGDGKLGGRKPENQTKFEVSYRLNPGRLGNVASESIQFLVDPGVEAIPPHDWITNCINYLPAIGGREPQSIDQIKRYAPEFFKANPLRAVNDQDFKDILGRMPDFQKIGSQQRWTGSWLTRYIVGDPFDANKPGFELQKTLFDAANSIRMTGRHLTVVPPVYRIFDLIIVVCVEQGHYYGQVKEGIIETLFGEGQNVPTGYFDPDNFSFGDPLRRYDLEAAVNSVVGVRGVHEIYVRLEKTGRFELFAGDRIDVGVNEIVQILNDRRRPDKGSVKIYDHSQEELVMEAIS